MMALCHFFCLEFRLVFTSLFLRAAKGMLSGSESLCHPDQAKFRAAALSYKSLQGAVLGCLGGDLCGREHFSAEVLTGTCQPQCWGSLEREMVLPGSVPSLGATGAPGGLKCLQLSEQRSCHFPQEEKGEERKAGEGRAQLVGRPLLKEAAKHKGGTHPHLEFICKSLSSHTPRMIIV